MIWASRGYPVPMVQQIDRTGLATSLAHMDAHERKVVGGLLVVLFQHPSRIHDREWLLEQLSQVIVLAGEHQTTEQVQAFMQAKVNDLLNGALRIFGCVGEDLAPRVANGITTEDATLQALTYLGQPDLPPDGPRA